jgi:uncharacterized protein (TIGR02266 family)
MSTPNPPASSPDLSADAPIRLAIDVSPDSESHFFSDLSGELSQGGIFVATYRDVTVGTPVSVVCCVDDQELVLCGVVAWQRDAGADSSPGIGVRWSTLSPSCQDAIERFCRRRAPLYYEVDLVAA